MNSTAWLVWSGNFVGKPEHPKIGIWGQGVKA